MAQKGKDRHGPILPQAPTGWSSDQQRLWNEQSRILSLFLDRVLWGCISEQYTISAATSVPTSVTLDMTSITVTAVAQTLARLLLDLKNSGTINVKEID